MKGTVIRAPRHYLVYLPCKTYVRKYIEKAYGRPIKASLKHSLGAMINASLDKNIYQNRKISESFIHRDFSDRLSIHLNEWQWSRIGFSFPPEKIAQINVFLEGVLEQHLHICCEEGVRNGRERYACIEEFAARYGISFPEDISWEGLVKVEYRFRCRRNKESEDPIAA